MFSSSLLLPTAVCSMNSSTGSVAASSKSMIRSFSSCLADIRILLVSSLPKFNFFFFFNHTAFKLYSLCHVGYLLDDFCVLNMCSCVGFQPYSPARDPDFFKPPPLLGFAPSYFPAVYFCLPSCLIPSRFLPLRLPRPLFDPIVQHPTSHCRLLLQPASYPLLCLR